MSYFYSSKVERSKSKTNVMMVRSKDLLPSMEGMIDEVSNLLNVPPSAAFGLLRNFRWNKENLLEEYMNNQEKTQKIAGVYGRCNPSMIPNDNDKGGNKHLCTICYDEVQRSEMISMPCTHAFCRDCWESFIKVMVQEGPTCVKKSCPQPKCNEMVSEVELKEATPYLHEKYKNFQLKNFIESSQTLKYCPGADCDRVANFLGVYFLGNELNAGKTCEACETDFCLGCEGEPHPSLTCKLLKAWMDKMKDPTESENWIRKNTKACPKCKVKIEKNHGCNHMTCSNCRHEFCWICFGDWRSHRNCSGPKIAQHGLSEESSRYLKTLELYTEHNLSQKFAQKSLDKINAFIDAEEEFDLDSSSLKHANRLVLKCRRVLKYTFVQEYYRPLDDLKAQRFDDLQKTLERHTDMLQGLTEKPKEDTFSNMSILRNQVRILLFPSALYRLYYHFV